MEHEFYMKRCLQLAGHAIGRTYPNPVVSCVIVHNDTIIGEGYHHKAGEAHAEINAIDSVQNSELLPESDIYVSLEPCAHYGKTPPCALKLKEIGFKNVYIGTLDAHDKVDGKGKKLLDDAGIQTNVGILERECREINRRFFTFHQKNRPYIILKWAESGDGFLDKDFKPYQISNKLASQFVHLLRANEHAILVGTHTAIGDNPSLDVRHIEGKNPVRILIDFDLKVDTQSNIFNELSETIVFNSIKDEKYDNIHFIKISRENAVSQMLKKLFEHNIQSILVEGGSFTHQKFISENLWDEAIIIKNDNLKLLNGTTSPKLTISPAEIFQMRDNTIEFYKNV